MFRKLDFVAIGDTVTDAFIRLEDATVTCDINHETCKICLPFAEKIPFESVDIVKAVGNSANAAVSAARLGLNTALISDFGNDQNGKECFQELKKNHVGTKYLNFHRGMKTNYHYVLWFEDERTILVKHETYPYKWPRLPAPKWLYLSSLAANSYDYHLQIISYLQKNPQVKLAFQPGTFQMKLGYEKLKELYKRTELFFCNVEEAKRILGIATNDHSSIKDLLVQMRELGPQIVCITDGPKGAYAYDGTDAWFMPPYPDPKPPYERTGAGDAFASTVTAALALGKPLSEALSWGPINSMSVVQYVGAQKGLLTQRELKEFLAKAPQDYRPRKI